MNSSGNDVWLGGVVDWDLLFLSTRGIWIWFGKWEILKKWCLNNGERERESSRICYEWLTYSTQDGRKGIYSPRRKLPVWESSCEPAVKSATLILPRTWSDEKTDTLDSAPLRLTWVYIVYQEPTVSETGSAQLGAYMIVCKGSQSPRDVGCYEAWEAQVPSMWNKYKPKIMKP
jgi:hypothetical protein